MIRVDRTGMHRLLVERSGYASYLSDAFAIVDSTGVDVALQLIFSGESAIALKPIHVIAPAPVESTIVPSINARPSSMVHFRQMKHGPQTNALEFVQATRSHWLRPRGNVRIGGAPTPVMVYLDGIRMGTAPEALRAIPVAWIEAMQFLDALEAPMYFGFRHDNGAILIKSRRN